MPIQLGRAQSCPGARVWARTTRQSRISSIESRVRASGGRQSASGASSSSSSSSSPLGGLRLAPGGVPGPAADLAGRESEPSWLCAASGGGGDGGSSGGDKGGNSGGGSEGGGDEEEEFLDVAAAEEMAAAKGAELPADWAAAAAEGGLRRSVLQQYLAIAGGSGVASMLARSVPAFRDRLIADRMYFFKILAEVCIDSACATVAEVRKRGDEFWGEFEFYLSDLLVGLVLDVVLVTLLAPVAVAGRQRKVVTGGIRGWASQFPSAVFEKSGVKRFSVRDRLGCYLARGLEYSLAGLVCGVVGQGVASGMMGLKRRYYGAKDDDVAVPPVLETGLVWAGFMGISANTRYQLVFGLERVVEETVARRVPGVAYLTTLLIRFANNVVGGEQFIDMARWAGIQ